MRSTSAISFINERQIFPSSISRYGPDEDHVSTLLNLLDEADSTRRDGLLIALGQPIVGGFNADRQPSLVTNVEANVDSMSVV